MQAKEAVDWTYQVADKTAQTIYIDADPRHCDGRHRRHRFLPGVGVGIQGDRGSRVRQRGLSADGEAACWTPAVLKDTMVLVYEWPTDRKSVRWSLVSSSLLKALDGAYRWRPRDLAPTSPTNSRSTCDPDDRTAQAQGRTAADRHRTERPEETGRGLSEAHAHPPAMRAPTLGPGSASSSAKAGSASPPWRRRPRCAPPWPATGCWSVSTDQAHSLGDVLGVPVPADRRPRTGPHPDRGGNRRQCRRATSTRWRWTPWPCSKPGGATSHPCWPPGSPNPI